MLTPEMECSGVRSDDYEKLVDREVRAAIQRMQAAEDAKQQGLRTWRLPESLKVCTAVFCNFAIPVLPTADTLFAVLPHVRTAMLLCCSGC